MYITRVQARGFKRGSFDVALDRANVITGDNFAGKTQILDAVRLGLIGYLPELGKLPSATFGLASATELRVILTFDDGQMIERQYWLEGDTVKQKHTVPPALKSCATLAVMLNAEEYFALGPLDRTRYVFSNCPVDVVTRTGITDRVKGVAPDYDMAEHFQELDALIEDQKARNKPAPTPQEEMEFILKRVADDWTNLGRSVQMHQGTINGITGQRAAETDEDAPAVPLVALQDQRAALTRQIAELNEKLGRFIGSFTQMKSDRARRAEIAREVEHGSKPRLQLAEAKDKLALLDAQISQFVRVTVEQTMASAARCAEAKNAGVTIARGYTAAKDERFKAEKLLAALDGLTTCPCCGASGEGWKALKAAEYAQAIDTFKATEEDLSRGVEQAATQLGIAERAHADLMAEAKRHNDADTLRAQVAASVAKLEPTLARLNALAEESERLMPDNPELEKQVEELQGQLNEKNDEARGLDNLIATAQQRAGDLVRMAEAEKQRDEATLKKDAAAAAGKELREIQGEMVARAFRPLLETANAIFAGVLPFALDYKDGEIGGRAGGVWRGHRTMSGVERALTYCAIQMALASRSPVKVAVLDEMTKLVSKRVPVFGAALLRAIADKVIDQVLIIDPERGDLYGCLPDVTDHEKRAFKVIAVG